MSVIPHVIDGPADVPAHALDRPTACALCSHNCGLRVDVEDNRIVAVRADETHPSTRGYSCNKAYAIPHYLNHAQRVEHPLKRRPDGSFERIGWDQAIAEIAARLDRIRREHAPRAIAFAGLGGQGGHTSGLGILPLAYGIGTPMIFTSLGQEKTQHNLIDRFMMRTTFDHYLVPDEHHARFMMVIGSNPLVSNRGINATESLRVLRADPARRLVVVDPRVTETARRAHRHLRLRPSSDVYVLLGLAGVIVQEGLVDRDFVRAKTLGFEALEALFRRVDVDEMARRAGLAADDLRLTAREYATTKPAAIAWDLGMEQAEHSTLTSYLVRVLAAITGNLGREGGNVFVQLFGPKMPYLRKLAKALASDIEPVPMVVPIPQFPPGILPEEITVDHPERIRALVCDGTNPLASWPDTNRFREAFGKLDLLVVVDPAMSETAREAHYVLPAAASYEKWDYSIFPKDIVMAQVRPPVVRGPDEALPEVEIYFRLARAMGIATEAPGLLHRLARRARTTWGAPAYLAALNAFAASKLGGPGAIVARSAFLTYETLGPTLPDPLLAFLWLSVLGYAATRRDQAERALPEVRSIRNPFALAEHLFAKLLAHPEGVHLGDLERARNFEYYCGHGDGRARLHRDDFVKALERVIRDDPSPTAADYPFVLDGGMRTHFTANTIMQDPAWRKGKGAQPALWMAEEDASALALADGETVRLVSRRGAVTVAVRIDATTQPGNLHLPNMLGQRYPDPASGELAPTGVAINELVDLDDRDPWTAIPHTKRIRCRVEKLAPAGAAHA